MQCEPCTAGRPTIPRDYTVLPRHIYLVKYWLVKQEPEAYSWSAFVKDGRTAWTGVRNFQARNNLRAMKKGDLVLYYHSVTGKQIMGIARVAKEAYPDPTAKEGNWSCVDLVPARPLAAPVALDTIKSDPTLKSLPLVKQGRLSVMPIPQQQFKRILQFGQTNVP